jgi:hypothetical protein
MARNRKIGLKAKKRWKQSMTRLIDGLGRRIVIYLPDRRSECPNCYYDKVHDKSSGVCKVDPSSPTYFTYGRCPVCNGKGVLTTSRRKCIQGIVIWNPQGNATNNLTFSAAGMEGATSVEVKTDVCYLDIIKTSKYVTIDGLKCKLSNPPIIRGIGGKSVLIVSFITMDKPRKGSGEYVN